MQMFRVNPTGYLVIDGHRVRIWRDRRSRSHAAGPARGRRPREGQTADLQIDCQNCAYEHGIDKPDLVQCT